MPTSSDITPAFTGMPTEHSTTSDVAPSVVAGSGRAPSVVAPSVVAPSGVAGSGRAPSVVAPSGVAGSGRSPSSGSAEFTAADVLTAHVGGKLSVELRAPLRNRRDLSPLYTPVVAGVVSL